MPNTALEFESLFAVDVETEANDGPNDFINKFVAASLHEAAGGDPAKLDAETKSIDARTTSVYKAIADAATKTPADANRLHKRGKTIEETVYAVSGRTVVAELENNIVIRTYEKESA